MFNSVCLSNENGMVCSLSNEFNLPVILSAKLEDAKSIEEVIELLNQYSKYNYNWRLELETSLKVICSGQDAFGNLHYIILKKEI